MQIVKPYQAVTTELIKRSPYMYLQNKEEYHMPHVSFYTPEQVYLDLRLAAAERKKGKDQSEIVTNALRLYLSLPEEEIKRLNKLYK